MSTLAVAVTVCPAVYGPSGLIDTEPPAGFETDAVIVAGSAEPLSSLGMGEPVWMM